MHYSAKFGQASAWRHLQIPERRELREKYGLEARINHPDRQALTQGLPGGTDAALDAQSGIRQHPRL